MPSSILFLCIFNWHLEFSLPLNDIAVQDVRPIYYKEDGRQTMNIKCEDFSTVCSTIRKKGVFYLGPDAARGKDLHSLAFWFINPNQTESWKIWGSLCPITGSHIYLFEQYD